MRSIRRYDIDLQMGVIRRARTFDGALDDSGRPGLDLQSLDLVG